MLHAALNSLSAMLQVASQVTGAAWHSDGLPMLAVAILPCVRDEASNGVLHLIGKRRCMARTASERAGFALGTSQLLLAARWVPNTNASSSGVAP